MRITSLLPWLLLLASCSGGGTVYTERDGLTIIEAENWSSSQGTNDLQWSAVRADGSAGSAVTPAGIGKASVALSYDVRFLDAGRRYLWLRGRQDDPDGSVALQLLSDGVTHASGVAQFSATWSWQLVATLDVLAEQSVRTTLASTDTSLLLDKLLFTDDASYTPSGADPEPAGSAAVVVVTDELQVDAGADASVTLPDTLSVSASVSHSFADGSLPALKWSTLSGPAHAIIAAPTSASSTVTFPLAGDYVLRFSASGGSLWRHDDIRVSVFDDNQPPVASIDNGSTDTIAQNRTLQLQASAEDDGQPDGALYYWWSLIDGPGEVFFSAQNQATTAASFSEQGLYHIQLSVQDGALNTVVSTQISVTEPVDTDPPQGQDAQAGADFEIVTGAPLDSSSTYTSGSFVLHNRSATATITSIAIDLASAAIGDIVFDPLGTAGDSAFKDLTVDSGAFETGYASRQFSADNAGGYDQMQLVFNDFQPGEQMSFSIDLDPANVRGVAPPGDRHAASISGFEIAGASVTVEYGDGSSQTGRMIGRSGSDTASQVQLRAQMPPPPVVSLAGVANFSTLDQDQQTVEISGQPSQQVRLFISEAGLYLDGTPNGGFDVDPYEPNTIIDVREHLITLDATGSASLVVQLVRSNNDAGFYILQAAALDGELVGSASDAVIVRRN